MKTFSIEPIGVIRSEIKNREDAPLFYTEGASNAFLEMIPEYTDGLDRMRVGEEIIVITWFHRARRGVLKVHPRGDVSNPLTGVFSTRSPRSSDPLGLHRVKVLEIRPGRLHIGPIEAIDGTPVVDIKPVVESKDYRHVISVSFSSSPIAISWSSNASSWSTVTGEMPGVPHRVDEVTRDDPKEDTPIVLRSLSGNRVPDF
jgi:tRNA-Thr(GGU) m(6)t(6)A37 methyltransferase TsaA